MLNKILKLWFVALIAIVFIGCEINEEDDGDNGEDQLVQYDCTNSNTILGVGVTFKSGSNGSVGYDCDNLDYTMSTNELIVSNIENTLESEGEDDGSDFDVRVTRNLATGVEIILATHEEYGSVSCQTTYNTNTPVYFYNTNLDGVEDLIDDTFDGLTGNSTCPNNYDWVYEYLELEGANNIEITITREITITDTSGSKHEISQYANGNVSF